MAGTFKLFEIAKVVTEDKKAKNKIRAAKQNAKAKIDAEDRLREVSLWLDEVICADARKDAKESWVMDEIRDLVNRASYPVEVYNLLTRGLRAVRALTF